MRKWHELFIIFMKGILSCENTVYKNITFKYITVYCCINLQGGTVSAKKRESVVRSAFVLTEYWKSHLLHTCIFKVEVSYLLQSLVSPRSL